MNTWVIKFAFAGLLVFSAVVSAYEPPSTPPLEAIERGRVAFVGRVVDISETAHSAHKSTASVTLQVSKVLYGLNLDSGNRVTLDCHTRWFLGEPGFGFDVRISDTLLVVLNAEHSGSNSELRFQSWYDDGIDLAYRFSDDPQEVADPFSEVVHLASTYGSWKGAVVVEELERVAENRRRMLAAVE